MSFHLPRACCALTLLLLATVACGGDPTEPNTPAVPVAQQIVLSPPAERLVYEESLQLEVTVFDQDGRVMPEATVAWSSADTGIIGVDDAGLVTALHVGSTTVTARSGEAAASAELNVDPLQIELTPLHEEVPAFQMARVTAPSARVAADSSVTGAIGGHEVGFTAVASDTLAFLVPPLDPGMHAATVMLDANHEGTFAISVSASNLPEDADAVVNPVLDRMIEALDDWAARAPDDPNLADARALLDGFLDDYAAATPEERLETAGYMAANPEAFSIFDNAGAVSAESSSLFMASSTRAAFRTNVRNFIGTQVGLGITVGVFSVTAWTCAVSGGTAFPYCLAAGASAIALLVNLDSAADAAGRLLDTVFVPMGELSVEVAGAGSPPTLSAGPVGSVSPQLQPNTPVQLEHGISHQLSVRNRYSTVTPADASSSDLLLDFSEALGLFEGIWSETASVLERIHGFISSAPRLHGDAPRYRAEPRSEFLVVEAGAVSLGTVSGETVECTGGPSGGTFTLTCTTEEFSDQHFVFDLVYSSDFGESSATFAAVLAPEDVERTITISNVSFTHDPNPEPHLCCLFVYMDVDVEVTGMLIDPEDSNPGSFSLSYTFSPHYDWSVINTYGTSAWWHGEQLRWGMSIHRAREVEEDEWERSSSVTLYITYTYEGVTSNTLVTSIGL